MSAVALMRIGPTAAEAVPDLIVALEDEAYVVRLWSVKALGEFGPRAKEAVDAIESIETTNENFRSVIQKALALINSDSQ